MYAQTCFLSQHRKILILLISSCCKMCTLPTIQSRVLSVANNTNTRDRIDGNGPHLTMGPDEQNQHFADLR